MLSLNGLVDLSHHLRRTFCVLQPFDTLLKREDFVWAEPVTFTDRYVTESAKFT
jgi:hypothetical protein